MTGEAKIAPNTDTVHCICTQNSDAAESLEFLTFVSFKISYFLCITVFYANAWWPKCATLLLFNHLQSFPAAKAQDNLLIDAWRSVHEMMRVCWMKPH